MYRAGDCSVKSLLCQAFIYDVFVVTEFRPDCAIELTANNNQSRHLVGHFAFSEINSLACGSFAGSIVRALRG